MGFLDWIKKELEKKEERDRQRAIEREHLRMVRKEAYAAERAKVKARRDFAREEAEKREMWRDPLGVERSRKFWSDVGLFPKTRKKRKRR